MLSDQGKLDEAVSLLQKLVALEPEHSHGWTALGVALARDGERGASLSAVQRAVEIDPENAHALRNLGALLIQENPEEALPYFERAVRLLPEDQNSHYGQAQCLLELGRSQEADGLFLKTIEMDPLSDVAEKARAARTSMAQSSLRGVTGENARTDATMYCLQGLRKFRELEAQEVRAIVFEIAMLGRGGLDINNPEKRYSLRSMPGDFSGLQLVSLMYVGMKLFDPKADFGIDLSKEYDAALRLFEKGVDG